MIGIIVGVIFVIIIAIILVCVLVNISNNKKDKYYLIILKNKIFNKHQFSKLFEKFSNKYHENPISINTINDLLDNDDSYVCLLTSDDYKLLDNARYSWNSWGYDSKIYNEYEFQNFKISYSNSENYRNFSNSNSSNDEKFNLIIMKKEILGIDHNFQILSNISKKYCASSSSAQYFKNEYMNQDFPFILLIYGSKDILLEVQKELKNNFINSFIKTQSEFEELIDDSNNYEINDAYKTLELNKNASLDEIKSAYRKLAKKYHPDLNKSTNAEEMFRKVNNAYNLLLEYLNSK